MMFKSSIAAATIAITIGAVSAPASAQGFFDNLFGGGVQPQQAVPAPSYNYDTPPFIQDAPVARPRARHKVALVSDKPKLQKPTDIMHDKTLENGDAVMTKDGLRLYVGDDGQAVHDKDEFAGVDSVDNLGKDERKALLAMDTTRNDPLRGSIAPDTVASGRSAAVSSPVVAGHDIVDARGKTVRYVGP